MKKRNSVIARILAALALIGVVVAVVVVVSNGLKDDSSSSKKNASHHAKQHKAKPQRTIPKTYEVQSGDTLISIAHKFGLTVAELQALNPEVDAQILTVGEVLTLRE
jgi:LysM repeat protein